jgi:hypothetical protein
MFGAETLLGAARTRSNPPGLRRTGGKFEMRLSALGCAIAAFTALGCSPKKPIEQDLQITVGGFMKRGDEHEKLKGTCRLVELGSILNCDIYSGLTKWHVTELVIRVTWYPYSEEDVRDFRQQVSISPLTTAPVSLRLGKQLTDMRWVVVGAKGVPEGIASN